MIREKAGVTASKDPNLVQHNHRLIKDSLGPSPQTETITIPLFPMFQKLEPQQHLRWCPLCFLILLLLGFPTTGDAQFNPLFPSDPVQQPDPILSHLRRLPRDPLAVSAYFKAKSALAEGDIAGGLESLQSMIDESTDFFQIKGLELVGSIRDEVEKTIAMHQTEYERLYGAEAGKLYEQALASQDTESLAVLIRRFRLTQAGQKGLRQWTALTVDEGDLGAATRELLHDLGQSSQDNSSSPEIRKKLRQTTRLLILSGRASRIPNWLSELDESLQNDAREILNGLPGDGFAQEAEVRLHDWSLPFGGLSHAGQTTFAPALLEQAWSRPLIDQYDFFLGDLDREKANLKDASELAHSTASKAWSQRNRTAFPAGRPLIVGNHAIIPGYASIKSFNLETGEIEGVGVNLDQSFEYLHELTAAPALMNDSFRGEIRELFFALRGWRDLSSCSLSSDGKYVYAVSDCQVVGSVSPEYLSRSTQRHELLPQAFNQLHAFELHAGLRNRWSVGTVDENAVLPFEPNSGINREIFFYGAPLPLNDQLFVIGEERGQIQLYELDRETGAVRWSLGLLNPDRDITLDESRRLAGLMPAYASGLLICPTGEGVVTAVDPLTRKVVWSHQYGKTRQIVLNRFMFRRGVRNRSQSVRQSIETFLGDDRWFDAKVVSSGDYVIHTPPDSDELVCLNLKDGSRVWEEDMFRLRSLYVGAVYQETLILIGRSEISAINLADASRVWSCSIPRPSGRGVRMGNHFVQPLISGEIAFIDLKTGRQLVRSPLPGGRVVGNLSAAHGRLLAQSGTEVIAFKSLSEIQQYLASTPEEATRHAWRGEMQLQQGERQNGISSLQSIQPETLTTRAKSVLAWAKLDGLQHNFEQHKAEVQKIENLLSTDEQRFQFLKSKASGLASSGDHLGAFRDYLTLFESLSGKAELRDVGGLQEVNEQRWTLAQLEDLYAATPAAQRENFVDELHLWLKETASDAAAMSLLNHFPLNGLDLQHVLERLKSVIDLQTHAGEISSLYESLSEVEEPRIAASALRELAFLALQFKDGTTADAYLSRLESLSVTPNDGAASAEVAKGIRAQPEWGEEFNSIPNWPANVQESDKNTPFAKSSRNQIPLYGPPSVPLRDWTFFLNPMGSHIDIYDAHGRRQCQLATGIVSTRFPIGSTLARYVSVRGHLALIVLADRFLLIDFQLRKDIPRVILSQLLITEDQNPFGTDSFVSNDQRPEPGFRTYRSFTPIGTPAGNVGPLGGSVLCFGQGAQLVAINPHSGQVLWKRHDLPLGSEIFSDEEFVLTLSPGQRTLNLYRAIDGTFLGTREVPQNAIDSILDRDNGDWGRYFPVIRKTATSFQFSLYDPVQMTVLWEFSAPVGTVWTTVDGQHLAFLNPQGELTIQHGITGKKQFAKTIPVSIPAKSLTVVTPPHQWIILPGSGTPQQFDFSYPSQITRTIEKTVHGTVVAINQNNGEVQWTREVENQKITTQSPLEWPILFFGNSTGRDVRGLILNRITGEVVVEDEWPYDRTWIHWQATTQPLQILIGYGRKTVTLDCHEPLLEKSRNKDEKNSDKEE